MEVEKPMDSGDFSRIFTKERNIDVGAAAMLLALTWSLRIEEEVKVVLKNTDLKFVVTEIGGKSYGEFQEKSTKAIIGACLNSGLIKKAATEIHAVLHAAEEAKRGLLINASSSTSLAMKIAIVRDKEWIAVAMFGQSAIHPITNHTRAGLGIMHINSFEETISNSHYEKK